MKVLSIQLGHNSTIALCENGVIEGVLSQEKCDNKKNSSDFPKDAISLLLKEINWDKKDIEKILISSLNVFPPSAFKYYKDNKGRNRDISIIIGVAKFLRNSLLGKLIPSFFEWLRKQRLKKLLEHGKQDLLNELNLLGLKEKPIEYIEHHLCHARSAYHSYENKKSTEPSLVFTLDGAGDHSCSSVTLINKNGEWEKIAETPIYSSLGIIYSETTRFLGMRPLEHEYKVMGLAAYSKPKYYQDLYERLFKPIIYLSDENNLVFKSKINTSNFYDYLAENAVGERFDNIAGALQLLTENLVDQWIKNGIKKTGVKKVFVGGGVFMNVKLNQKIQQNSIIKKLYFMPSCGDESNPIGACYYHSSMNGEITKPLKNLYLGTSYQDKEIKQFIIKNNLEKKFLIQTYDDIEEKIADLLINRDIVARFASRGEWGARSLGNRAILAHPSYMESFYMVNDFIKSRDFWMPFAPTILDNYASKYLEHYNPEKTKAPYMINAYKATSKAVNDLRAALHQGDHTLRPQVLYKSSNPKYYKILSLFEKQTGIGGVLNTSFNLHGYPLVSSLEQALMTFENSGLKYLAIEKFLLSKK